MYNNFRKTASGKIQLRLPQSSVAPFCKRGMRVVAACMPGSTPALKMRERKKDLCSTSL